VGQFMKCGAVIAWRVIERFLRRQMDAVRGRAIEGAVALVVRDLRPGIGENALAAVNGLECEALLALEGRHTFDLFGVEDGVNPVNEPAVILFGGFVAAVSDGFPFFSSGFEFTSQNSMWVPFSPLRTCQPFSAACLYVIQRGSSYPRESPVAMRWTALPPRYALSVVGLNGIPADSHGFCHGATPSSSILTIESVTS